jgi:hypothetical protein
VEESNLFDHHSISIITQSKAHASPPSIRVRYTLEMVFVCMPGIYE